MVHFHTGTDHIDARLGLCVSKLRERFAERLTAVYLSGSWQEGSAVEGSDLDLIVVFGQVTEQSDAHVLSLLTSELDEHGTPEVGFLKVDPSMLARPLPSYMKHAALLWGEDVFMDAEEMSALATQRRWALGALRLLEMLGHSSGGGYDLGDATAPRTKLLVSTVARMAGARIAACGECMPSKSACCMRYRDIVGDEDADTVEEVYDVFKLRWRYLWPEQEQENAAEIERLCRAVHLMEHRFIAQVIDWMTQARRSKDPEAMAWAARCASYIDEHSQEEIAHTINPRRL